MLFNKVANINEIYIVDIYGCLLHIIPYKNIYIYYYICTNFTMEIYGNTAPDIEQYKSYITFSYGLLSKWLVVGQDKLDPTSGQ